MKEKPVKLSRFKIRWVNNYVGEIVLDAGCGKEAFYTNYLRSRGYEVFPIDILDKVNISGYKKASVESLPFKSDYFDTVLLFDVLEHTKDHIKSLKEVYRVLKKSGTLILSVPNSNNISLHKYNVVYKHHIDKSHFREYSEEEIIKIIENNGFKILEHGLEGPVKAALISEFVPSALKKITFLGVSGLQMLGLLKNKDLYADIFVTARKTR